MQEKKRRGVEKNYSQPVIVILLATFKPLYIDVIMYSPAGKLIVKPAIPSSPLILV